MNHDKPRQAQGANSFIRTLQQFGRPEPVQAGGADVVDASRLAPGCRFGCCPRIVGGVPEHEVYPRAPIVVATVEVRHTETPSLTQTERKKVKQALSRWAPIQRSSKQLVVTGVIGAAGAGDQAFEEFPKYFSRDSMLAISFRKEAVVIEATRYDGWLEFRQVIEAAVEIRAEIGVPDAVERVGVRYLNEIRPEGGALVDWSDWLNSAVLGPIELEDSVGLEAKQWQGQAVYGPEDGRSLVLRYAPGEGQAVETGQELVRSKFTPGPFMWIDIDSFWLHEGTLPEFEAEVILGKCVDLHMPIRTLFEKLITPKLREVLRRG